MFDGLYNFCTKYTGGSIGGAVLLNYEKADTVINWAGGLHHGKRSEVRPGRTLPCGRRTNEVLVKG